MKRRIMLMLICAIFCVGAVLVAFTPTRAQETPVRGGILKVIMRREAASFGYPLTLASADRNFAVPFFDRLLTVAEGVLINRNWLPVGRLLPMASLSPLN